MHPYEAVETNDGSKMKPSLTTAGFTWVGQFDESVRPFATLLIDSLEIHDQTNVLTTIIDQIRILVGQQMHAHPAVVLPIRSMEDLPDLPDGSANHVAYKTFNPGSSFPPLPGSEAEVGSAIRTLIQGNPETFLSPESTLDQLRERKVRSIFLVTDYSGSGKQAFRFAQAFTSNPTIASWISYGLTTIYVVTYAASLDATNLLKNQKYLQFSTHVIAKSAASADWSKTQRQGIVDFCKTYAIADEKQHPLGYKNSFGLYLTNFRVPNNLPQVLIRTSGNPPGLFAGREMPASFFRQLPTYVPPQSLDQLLRNIGAEDLADLLRDTTRPIKALRSLAILQLAEYKIDANQIDAMLGLDEVTLRELKTSLIALDCLTLDGTITARGRRELARARNTRPRWLPKPTKYVSSNVIPYIPNQLR